MEDPLLELLLAIAEIFGEAILELVAGLLVDLLSRAFRKLFSPDTGPFAAATGYLALGMATGGMSLLLFPHPLVHPARIHGISLVISPVITGLVMSLLGSILRRSGKEPTRIESFGYGFAFALGMAAIRFLFAK